MKYVSDLMLLILFTITRLNTISTNCITLKHKILDHHGAHILDGSFGSVMTGIIIL